MTDSMETDYKLLDHYHDMVSFWGIGSGEAGSAYVALEIANPELAKSSYAKIEDSEEPALIDDLKWFYNRRQVIQAKFDLHGPQDTAQAMRTVFSRLEKKLH